MWAATWASMGPYKGSFLYAGEGGFYPRQSQYFVLSLYPIIPHCKKTQLPTFRMWQAGY